MAKTDNDSANLDDLGGHLDDLTGKEADLLEGAGEEPADDLEELPADNFSKGDVAGEAAPADLAEADLAKVAVAAPTAPAQAAEEEEEEEERETSKLPMVLEIAAIIAVPAAIAGLFVMQTFDAWSCLYVFLLACIPYALWKGRATNTVFTVFLGCILAAELTAIFCLLKEFQHYGYNVSARAARQKFSMAAPNYPGAVDPGSLA